MQRKLIVNADDLGLTTGVNDGIFDAHDRGILTSASLFANARATGDAIRRAHLRPSLGVGCHLTLVDGQPTLPPSRVSTLIEDDGRFRRSWKPFIVAYLRGHVSLVEVELELTAQVDRLASQGIALTHLDTHKHVHAFPPIFSIVARIAERFGVPIVRVPFERWSAVRRSASWTRAARHQALVNFATWPWARRNRRTAAAFGLESPNFIGRIHTGILTAAVVAEEIRALPEGATELMVHPGYPDAALLHVNTRLRASRAEEVELLRAAEIQHLIAKERIELVRHDLAFPVRRSLRHAS